jgi:hypothetical protein
MVVSPHSNSIFIKYIQETFVPVAATDTYSCVAVYLHPLTLLPDGEIFKSSRGLHHPGETLTGYTWDRRLGPVEEISFLHLPAVEPRFFGLSVCTLLGVPTALFRFFIWTSTYHAYSFPYVKVKQSRYRPGVAQRVPGS